MHKHNAHGCTDVTGFGLLGHAENLAKIQKNEVCFIIHNLPIISKMAAVSKACKSDGMFNLLKGTSAETSGRWSILSLTSAERRLTACVLVFFLYHLYHVYQSKSYSTPKNGACTGCYKRQPQCLAIRLTGHGQRTDPVSHVILVGRQVHIVL